MPGEPEFFSGGAGAFATAGDYLRFMRALLRGGELDGERLLRAETVDLAFADHLQGAPLPDVIRSAVPELCNDIPSLPVAQGFGLGFHLVLEDLPGMRRAGTGDWAGLCNCYYWIDRASGVAGAFLTQVLPFYDARIVETCARFEEAVYAEVGAPAATV
jgi:CubicO group peptidase (beta-lactamase class C family)